MVTTTWIAGSGDWNSASNWSNGVPGPADTAVIGNNLTVGGPYTITGGGTVATLDIELLKRADEPTLSGAYVAGTFLDDNLVAHLAPSAVLSFGSATISGTTFEVQPGATFGPGPLTLANGKLVGTTGNLANPLTVQGNSVIDETGSATTTLTGPIGGSGSLQLFGNVVVAAASSLSAPLLVGGYGSPAGTEDVQSHVELAAPGSAGTGPVVLATGTLAIDRGVLVGSITAATLDDAAINATDQSDTVFAGHFGLSYTNGSGHPTIIGALAPGPALRNEGPMIFGAMTVQGGTGSITVFGGNSSCLAYGGTAGGNVLIGGADLSAYGTLSADGSYYQPPNFLAYVDEPGPATLFAGGDRDLLVATGTENNKPGYPDATLIAAGGRETLTGAGSTGRVLIFGSNGADVIAAGAGASTIVAGSGAATISGGSAGTAIFAGTGSAVVLGGSGADYVQVGAGNATLFAGSGMDLIGLVSGQAGGSLVVSGFRPGTDRISAQGYYLSAFTENTTGGNTVIQFNDNTRLTLLGVTSPIGSFS